MTLKVKYRAKITAFRSDHGTVQPKHLKQHDTYEAALADIEDMATWPVVIRLEGQVEKIYVKDADG